MADFDLQQTDQQVQDILNDAQDAMGAGAQTTLTTDYIMLKGTNGRYHKILKDSFTEAVRNVLGGLLVNNDKGTTISQIAAIASGDFGSITPANLASVLGVGYFFGSIPQNRYIPVDGDCLNINEGGLWQITGSATPGAGPEHSPSKGKYFYVFAFGTEGVAMLLAVQTRMESAYIGVKRDNDIIWKPIMFTT